MTPSPSSSPLLSVANIRAGYVYVISNIGAFGPNIVKIGMTRRLEPMDRVRELGDAVAVEDVPRPAATLRRYRHAGCDHDADDCEDDEYLSM